MEQISWPKEAQWKDPSNCWQFSKLSASVHVEREAESSTPAESYRVNSAWDHFLLTKKLIIGSVWAEDLSVVRRERRSRHGKCMGVVRWDMSLHSCSVLCCVNCCSSEALSSFLIPLHCARRRRVILWMLKVNILTEGQILHCFLPIWVQLTMNSLQHSVELASFKCLQNN